ncbi:MAG TPA: hypothetical protein VGC91_05465 [Pyrinomonadaceae bacterium]
MDLNLREKGIYRTPDGARLVASSQRSSVFHSSKVVVRTGDGAGCYLYTTYSWAFHGAADYIVNERGEVLASDDSTPLRVEDLTDTGWTAGTH